MLVGFIVFEYSYFHGLFTAMLRHNECVFISCLVSLLVHRVIILRHFGMGQFLKTAPKKSSREFSVEVVYCLFSYFIIVAVSAATGFSC